MVVLAVSITTRKGKPLLSRQFRDITKDRVMELLSNFQTLVANSSKQHTFVEDEHVRYVYKPFDDYYIILITNLHSNIIQDMDTLNIFVQTVDSTLKGLSEEDVFDSAFDILNSFDEIITMGYKENLSLTQIKTFLAMESHEERIQEIIERNKEFEAAEERKRRAKEISRKEQARKLGIPDTQEFTGIHGGVMNKAYDSYYSHASSAAQQSHMHTQSNQGIQQQNLAPQHQQQQQYVNREPLGGKGLQVNGPRRGVERPIKNVERQSLSVQTATLPEEEKPINNGILISVKETINAEISRDGAIMGSELKGVLELRVNNPDLAHAKLCLGADVDVKDKTYQFKTHPNVDKAGFLTNKTIGLRDPNKPFPSNDQSLGVLRWRKVKGADEHDLIPLEISTWLSPSSETDNAIDVTFEYEVNSDYEGTIDELRFLIPVFTDTVFIKDDLNEANAVVEAIDESQGIIIKVDPIESGQSSVFSVTVQAAYEDALFPIEVALKNSNAKPLSNLNIASVVSATDDSELPFDTVSTLKSEQYVVV
ncbi:Ret2 [Kluyveromyces lactis]|nr:Ret2 [Kluyveromyces lactis]